MKVLNVSMILALTLLVSCGGSKGGSKGGESKSNQSSGSDAVTEGDRKIYTTGCVKQVEEDEDGQSILYTKADLETIYDEESDTFAVTLKNTISEKAGCKNPALEMKSTGSGQTGRGDETLKVDFTKEEWTVNYQEIVEEFNELNECGLSWKKGRSNDVSNTPCSEIIGEVEIFHKNQRELLICKNGATPDSAGPEDCLSMKLK